VTDPDRMIGRLDGRIAIVTGGSKGIGLAIVRRFLADGATVAIIDLAAPPHDLAQPSTYFRADVTSRDDVVRVFAEISATVGRTDILVNNVGGGGSPPLPLIDILPLAITTLP